MRPGDVAIVTGPGCRRVASGVPAGYEELVRLLGGCAAGIANRRAGYGAAGYGARSGRSNRITATVTGAPATGARTAASGRLRPLRSGSALM